MQPENQSTPSSLKTVGPLREQELIEYIAEDQIDEIMGKGPWGSVVLPTSLSGSPVEIVRVNEPDSDCEEYLLTFGPRTKLDPGPHNWRPYRPKDEIFEFEGADEVMALARELGLNDWPAQHLEEGFLFRAISDDPRHWVILLVMVAEDAFDFYAIGIPKSKFTRDQAEKVAQETFAEFSVAEPFFKN
jgi:hypothetical protein